MTATPITLNRLGAVQREEVSHGLDVDRDEVSMGTDGYVIWGELVGSTLVINDVVAFVYRMTSAADIAADNLSSAYAFPEDAASYRSMLNACRRVLARAWEMFDDEDRQAIADASSHASYLARHVDVAATLPARR